VYPAEFALEISAIFYHGYGFLLIVLTLDEQYIQGMRVIFIFFLQEKNIWANNDEIIKRKK
jgi:hypothetical protein